MNTPTPRTALKATGVRRRDARCPETELAAITAERDQLCAEVERLNAIGSWSHTCIHHNDKQRTECSVCLVTTLTAERDQLRAELSDQAARFHDEIVSRQGTVRANQELDLKELNHFRAELAAEREKVTMLLSDAYALTKNWHDRAERAEAELTTERARLDWLMAGGVCMVQHTGGFYVSRLHYAVSRAAIDAAMKEDRA